MAAIKDVARVAGLSVSAVSKYLKNSNSVRPETREQIERAIKELNYTPNSAARSLRTGRTGVLMVVFPEIRDYLFTSFVSCLQTRAQEKGINILISSEDCLHTSLNAPVPFSNPCTLADGVIYFVGEDKSIIPLLSPYTKNKPQLSISRISFSPTIPNAYWDVEDAIYRMTQRIIQYGHVRIAYAGTTPSDSEYNSTFNGFLRAMHDANIDVPSDFIYKRVRHTHGVEEGLAASAQFFSCLEPPTAIVTDSDFIAIGCWQYAMRHGLSVPEDLAITGMGDTPPTEVTTPPITSIQLPIVPLAEWVIDQMQGMLNSQDSSTISGNTYFPTKPVVRRSIDPELPPYILPDQSRFD